MADKVRNGLLKQITQKGEKQASKKIVEKLNLKPICLLGKGSLCSSKAGYIILARKMGCKKPPPWLKFWGCTCKRHHLTAQRGKAPLLWLYPTRSQTLNIDKLEVAQRRARKEIKINWVNFVVYMTNSLCWVQWGYCAFTSEWVRPELEALLFAWTFYSSMCRRHLKAHLAVPTCPGPVL